jgi:hypothetical protein
LFLRLKSFFAFATDFCAPSIPRFPAEWVGDQENYGLHNSRERFREPLNKCQVQENHPSGAKARVDYADFSGTAEAVPFQNKTYSELP